jgi:acetyltransferase
MPTPRVAVRPYPAELAEEVQLGSGHFLLRPIRPQDAPEHRRFLSLISPEDLRMRFFDSVRELPQAELAHFTHVDYDREMAFVAVGHAASGAEEILGVARACFDPGKRTAEFAVLVRSDLKRQGLGKALMQKLIRYCRDHGMRELWGSILSENIAMKHLARSLGFTVRSTDGGVEEVVLDLQPQGPLSTALPFSPAPSLVS